ncbi:elongation factor Tu, putative [Plasmodium ovale curtisi]|uniref:Elongation factor Tu, putative n=1 Tax=Plasmodium ovale curtisi TaxID=864141 RepID=A0A1A8W1V4_PLAOA|nr:elongation factor Tu, putative [Plasmodium ovale curtisi]
MSSKKGGKHLLYDDYQDDFEDYDNYDEEQYSEFECKEKANSLNTKTCDSKKKNITTMKVEKKEKSGKNEKDGAQGRGGNQKGAEKGIGENQKGVVKEKVSKKKELIISVKTCKENKYIMLSTLNVLVLGHIDAGKSTLIGALLYNLNYVSEQTLKKYERVRESAKYTYILDEEEEERERNITLFNKKKEFFVYYTKNDMKQAYLHMLNSEKAGKYRNTVKIDGKKVKDNENAETFNVDRILEWKDFQNGESSEPIYIDRNTFENLYKRQIIHNDVVCFRKINIFDTPGHNELVNNLHSCSFFADCAILVVDANNIYNKKNDETYRNVSILKSVGISNIIVVVNKIDLFDYDENIFESICSTIKSFFECNKNDSIYEFVLNNNFYVRTICPGKSCDATQKGRCNRHLFERKLIFTPVSAYKNKNIVKFEKGNIPLFNRNYCLYDEIKFMNLRKDLFQFKVCKEFLCDEKNVLASYYNFVDCDIANKDNKGCETKKALFANNLFYNYGEGDNEMSLHSVRKSRKEDDSMFVGVIQDFTESNNLIKASIKILNGFLKEKNDYTILPLGEKATIKKIEKNTCFCKYININNLCDYLINTKDFGLIKQLFLKEADSVFSNSKMEKKNANMQEGSLAYFPYPNESIQNAYTENHFPDFIKVLSEVAKNCVVNEHVNITNDIVENVSLKIDDNKIHNGCVFVNNTVESIAECSPYAMNTVIICNRMNVLIKMNEIKIPLVTGRQYLLYSLNFTHSITIKRVYYVYKNKNSPLNSIDFPHNKLKVNGADKNSTHIRNLEMYKKKNNILYERVENTRCLRSHETGIIEIEVNNNSLMCTQHFGNELNYFITLDGPFFNIYDFLSFSVSPLSRFILSEENQIVASGLVLKEK